MRTKAIPLLRTTVILASIALTQCIHAQDARLDSALSVAQSHLAPTKYNLWNSTWGDLDGDGVEDVAMIFETREPPSGANWEIRLVVLLGSKSGAYTVLSTSGDYCQPRYAFELEIRDSSLYVQAMESIDSRDLTTVTWQFRFNPHIRDLELIGREELHEDMETDNNHRVSTNYARSLTIQSWRKGKQYKEIKERLPHAPLARLQGLNCEPDDIPTEP